MNFKNLQTVEEILTSGIKRCNKCGELLPLSEYFSDKSKRDGYTTFCKKCKLESCKKWESNNQDKVKEYKKNHSKKETARLKIKEWEKNNKEKVKKSHEKYYENNKEKIKESRKRYQENNKDKIKESRRISREKNREKYLESKRKWKRENKGMVNYYTNKRRKHIKLRTPPWADQKKIREIYINCPEGYDVDHIIPLQGKTVSGLHIPENLQYLPRNENQRKSNKLLDTYLNNETVIICPIQTDEE